MYIGACKKDYIFEVSNFTQHNIFQLVTVKKLSGETFRLQKGGFIIMWYHPA